MKEELICFGDNDLVLGLRPIYEYVVLRYGGNTWQKWESETSLKASIKRAMFESENIHFIVSGITPHKNLFKVSLSYLVGHWFEF